MKKINKKLNFTDAQEMAIIHPNTFSAPSKQELDSIKVGDCVKVSHIDERFWNVVKKIKGDTITAEVNNDLICKHPFKCGDEIVFEKRHVYCIFDK